MCSASIANNKNIVFFFFELCLLEKKLVFLQNICTYSNDQNYQLLIDHFKFGKKRHENTAIIDGQIPGPWPIFKRTVISAETYRLLIVHSGDNDININMKISIWCKKNLFKSLHSLGKKSTRHICHRPTT